MISLITFRISESQNIEIGIEKQNKINTYGYQSEGLHVFDEVEVKYIYDGKVIILARDSAQYIMSTFLVILEKSLRNELSLDDSLAIGRVGYSFNKKISINTDKLEEKDDIFEQYWVWSSPENVQTWLYNTNNKIYFEISLTYPWLFLDPDEGESYISFDEYMKNYKPIVIIELNDELVLEWINQCHKVLQTIKTV